MRWRTRRITAQDELPARRVLGRCQAEALAHRETVRPLSPRLDRNFRRSYATNGSHQKRFVSRYVRAVRGDDARSIDQATGRVNAADSRDLACPAQAKRDGAWRQIERPLVRLRCFVSPLTAVGRRPQAGTVLVIGQRDHASVGVSAGRLTSDFPEPPLPGETQVRQISGAVRPRQARPGLARCSEQFLGLAEIRDEGFGDAPAIGAHAEIDIRRWHESRSQPLKAEPLRPGLTGTTRPARPFAQSARAPAHRWVARRPHRCLRESWTRIPGWHLAAGTWS